MKSLPFLFFISLFSCYSQTEKGSKLIGGGFSASYAVYENEEFGNRYQSSSKSLNVSPRMAYLVWDDIAIGMAVDALYFRSKNDYASNKRVNIIKTIGIGPFFRRYFSLGDQVATYAQASSRISFGTNEEKSTNPRIGNITGIIGSIAFGIVYFPTPKWGLEASYGNLHFDYLRTNYGKDSNGDPQKATSKYLAASFSTSTLYFGLQYYFR